MSDYYIPFEIQSEIMKRLPVKSLLQFRSVSKQWKSFIDCPKFIKTYHPNPQHHLLVQYKLAYTSIIDNKTFLKQKFPLTALEPLNSLGSVDGLLCFSGWYNLKTWMVVIWNPSVRKCVGIIIPNAHNSIHVHTRIRIGFGVCRETNDPKLVKINVVQYPSSYWEVQVFTLSSRVWKTVYTGAPFTSDGLKWDHVFIDGNIYWSTHGSFIISFHLKSEKFGKVCLPERLTAILFHVTLVKVNESLGLLEYSDEEGGMSLCGVWMRKDGINKPFTKIYTVKVDGKLVGNRVLGFRSNGEVLLELNDDDFYQSCLQVYEPSSGRINSVGISGELYAFTVCSYMETLLLVDQSNSIIH